MLAERFEASFRARPFRALSVHLVDGREIKVTFERSPQAPMHLPEVWRYDGKTLHIYRLQRKGHYLQVEKSTVLPQLPVADCVRFLRKQGTLNDTRLAQSFRAWVHGRFGK